MAIRVSHREVDRRPGILAVGGLTNSGTAGIIPTNSIGVYDMKLSTRGDYAARVIMEMAAAGEGPRAISVTDLAKRTGITPKYLEQIMSRLRAAHVVRSRRGVHGGYALARGPREVTVGEVIRLMDGPLAPSPCASRSAHAPCPSYRCPTEADCVLRGLWLDVRDAISGVLDNTTFGELAERQRRSQSQGRAMYHI